jgi:DNA-directed RNA polymerase subunit F
MPSSPNAQRRKDEQARKLAKLTPADKLKIVEDLNNTFKILREAGKKALSNDPRIKRTV